MLVIDFRYNFTIIIGENVVQIFGNRKQAYVATYPINMFLKLEYCKFYLLVNSKLCCRYRFWIFSGGNHNMVRNIVTIEQIFT